MRANLSAILKKRDKIGEQNVSRQEWEAVDQLKKDDSIIILPADKGRVTVINAS